MNDMWTPFHDTDDWYAKGTNQNGPGGASTPKTGASSTDRSRLVPSVPSTPPAPPALCPECGEHGQGHRLAAVPEDVPRAEYLCIGGHLWITSWFSPQDGAA